MQSVSVVFTRDKKLLSFEGWDKCRAFEKFFVLILNMEVDTTPIVSDKMPHDNKRKMPDQMPNPSF